MIREEEIRSERIFDDELIRFRSHSTFKIQYHIMLTSNNYKDDACECSATVQCASTGLCASHTIRCVGAIFIYRSRAKAVSKAKLVSNRIKPIHR